MEDAARLIETILHGKSFHIPHSIATLTGDSTAVTAYNYRHLATIDYPLMTDTVIAAIIVARIEWR